jgi:hypothetical protein
MESPLHRARSALPHIRLGVIDDARRRQRRRRVASLALVLAALVAASLVIEDRAGEQPAPQPEPATPAARLVAPSAVLSRTPYMGVSCTTPNSTRCDRLGLAVWLKRPAVAVSAEIHGRPFALDNRDSLDERQSIAAAHGKRRTQFIGYLDRAKLRSTYHLPPDWMGAGTPEPLVRLRVDEGRGGPLETRVPVPLMAGWG